MIPLKATFGNDATFIKVGLRKLRCYVLENEARVFAREEVQKALGYSGSSKEWLRDFLIHINRLMTIPPDIIELVDQALPFSVAQAPQNFVRHAVTPEILMRICTIIIKAKDLGYLYQSELKHAKAAAELQSFFKQRQPNAVIDYISGFDNYKNNLKYFLSDKVRLSDYSPVSQWIKSIPDDFFDLMFKLRNGSWKDVPQDWEWYTNQLIDLIFARISTSDLEALVDGRPKMKYKSEYSSEKYLPTLALQEHLYLLRRLYDLAVEEDIPFKELIEKYLPVQTPQLTQRVTQNTSHKKLEDIRAALELVLKKR